MFNISHLVSKILEQLAIEELPSNNLASGHQLAPKIIIGCCFIDVDLCINFFKLHLSITGHLNGSG